jgi:hypothetical protein
LLGIMVVSVASLAWAGVPDLDLSDATTGTAGASVYNAPNGGGVPFTQAFANAGGVVDATITLTLVDDQGAPIFAYPFEDLWLDVTTNNAGTNFVYCNGGTVADVATDEMGMTEWADPLLAGGSSGGESTLVYVAGTALNGVALPITYNSADINGDLVANLTDVIIFKGLLDTDPNNYTGDFNNDGVINLSDVVLFAPPAANVVGCP